MKAGINNQEWAQLLELKAKMNKEQVEHFKKLLGEEFCCHNCGYVNKESTKNDEWLTA